MSSSDLPLGTTQPWRTLLGDAPQIHPPLPGRELWPLTAEDGRKYLLKRLGPWLNLPVADQARVLTHLARSGIGVAEFQITDDARLVVGADEDNIILLPHLAHDQMEPGRALEVEASVGSAVARLHAALDAYPWTANTYRERIAEGLAGDLLLPGDVRELFTHRREAIMSALATLPLQLVHGDLTPGNVLFSQAARTAAFIDLDHLPLAPRTWDIGTYLSRRLRRLPHPVALEHVSRFVRGYHGTSPLDEAEIRAIPAMIAAKHLLEASWTQRILSGLLERRLLPSQAAELEPTLEALRRQLHEGSALTEAVRSGADASRPSLPRPGGTGG